jgi:enamine deaminase RidA (YjgF/YER057c/UK114 family)
MTAMLDAAGATWDDVAKINFWVSDLAHRQLVEPNPPGTPDCNARAQASADLRVHGNVTVNACATVGG